MSNIATSSKRPLPSSSALTTPSAKRARVSNSSSASSLHHDEDDEQLDEADEVVPLDETALERKARKDARTIRNRESAQRSRNQRKAHLAWLEVRVVELEEENRRLRGEGPSASITPTASSPPQTLASIPSPTPSDLTSVGLSTSTYTDLPGGINLAEVAPPPPGVISADTDGKSLSPTEVDQLRAENAALRARLALFDGLVRQAQAVANIGVQHNTESKPLVESTPLDWDSVFNTTQPLDITSAPLLPSTSSSTLCGTPSSHSNRQTSPTLYSFPTSLDLATLDSTHQSSPTLPLACHPAAVATPSVQTEWSLQRARTDSGLISGVSTVAKSGMVWTEKRLDGVARVLVALAKIRGWIPSSPSMLPSRARVGQWSGRNRASVRRHDRRRTSGAVLRRGGMKG